MARVESVVDAATGGVDLFARLGSDQHTNLRPESFVEVNLADRPFLNVVRLPETALHGDIIYVVRRKRWSPARLHLQVVLVMKS